jgi:hypothetical protein
MRSLKRRERVQVDGFDGSYIILYQKLHWMALGYGMGYQGVLDGRVVIDNHKRRISTRRLSSELLG